MRYILSQDRYSVNDEDFESQTALHLAAAAGHHDIVMELVLAGADIQVSEAVSDWSVGCNEEL